MKRTTRILLPLFGGLLGLSLVASAISALSNRSLLAEYSLTGATPAPTERLAALDKARLAEALQLKHALGDQVWPGWGRADIPVILWTAGAEFLTGLHAHQATTVPARLEAAEQAHRMGDSYQEGETRFYYTGMAQAMLLDLLAPG